MRCQLPAWCLPTRSRSPARRTGSTSSRPSTTRRGWGLLPACKNGTWNPAIDRPGSSSDPLPSNPKMERDVGWCRLRTDLGMRYRSTAQLKLCHAKWNETHRGEIAGSVPQRILSPYSSVSYEKNATSRGVPKSVPRRRLRMQCPTRHVILDALVAPLKQRCLPYVQKNPSNRLAGSDAPTQVRISGNSTSLHSRLGPRRLVACSPGNRGGGWSSKCATLLAWSADSDHHLCGAGILPALQTHGTRTLPPAIRHPTCSVWIG